MTSGIKTKLTLLKFLVNVTEAMNVLRSSDERDTLAGVDRLTLRD